MVDISPTRAKSFNLPPGEYSGPEIPMAGVRFRMVPGNALQHIHEPPPGEQN